MNPDRPRNLILPSIKDNSRHSKYINILTKLAIAVEPVAQARISSCLVYKNEIISFGMCKMKSHPFQARFGKNSDSIYLHAETDCIKNALKLIDMNELSRCSLYICRVKYECRLKNSVVYGMAKPCCGCSRAIATFGINKVFYTTDENTYEAL